VPFAIEVLMRRWTGLTVLCVIAAACAEPEVHLIPAGFEGPVIIIFNDPNGAPMRREGRARRYDIPVSGVLRTQFGPSSGFGRPDYEYVDSAGHRTAIVPGTPCVDSLPGDPVQACLDAVRLNGNGAQGPHYEAYVVSHRANRRIMYDRGSHLVDSMLFGGAMYRRPPN